MEQLAYVDSSYDSIKLGIIIKIPITGVSSSGLKQEMEGCPKCGLWLLTTSLRSYHGDKRIPTDGAYCKYCGTAREIQEREGKPEPIPLPDIRQELVELELEYEPFDQDLFWMPHSDREGGGYALADDDSNWIIFVHEYAIFGHRSDYNGGVLGEYDLKQIASNMSEAKKKYARFLKKYNGEICFGSVSCATNW